MSPTRSAGPCIVCGSGDLVDILETPCLPIICTQLLYAAEEARRVCRAAVSLAGCRSCGHLFNAAFDPALVTYDSTYENSLMGSPRYRQYTTDLIEQLISAYDLKGGTVVEIGCGRGEFMRMLCSRGILRAIGFDPGRPAEVATVGEATLEIIDKPFDTATAPPQPDLICSRHVLEHLPQPVSLLQSLATACASPSDCTLFIEVPNGALMAKELCVWDLLYAHVSYFTASSLSRALRAAGIVAERIETTFSGQFLIAEARIGRQSGEPPGPEPILTTAEPFEALQLGFTRAVDWWKSWLRAARQRGRRLALWGAGAKAVTFLNLVDQADQSAVGLTVDINPLKWGTFIAGTGHPTAAPSALREFRPDAILVMNPEYKAEIHHTMKALGVRADLITVAGFEEMEKQSEDFHVRCGI